MIKHSQVSAKKISYKHVVITIVNNRQTIVNDNVSHT